MSKEHKHSPLPWIVNEDDSAWIQDASRTKHYVALCMKRSEPYNAAFIVRACNAHYELLDALEGLLISYERTPEFSVSELPPETIEAEKIANVILAKAKGEA